MAKARVQSIPVLKSVKLALLEFVESVQATMASVDAEIGRISQWLSQERPAHWKGEIRRRSEMVTKARAEIERKRLIAAPAPASVALEQRALERAKVRLEEANKRMDAVRRWSPVWDRQALMYKSACHGLNESVHFEIPRAIARLERMLQSLEEYTRIVAPPEGSTGADLPTAPAEPAEETEPKTDGDAGPGTGVAP
jgi:hypothetical protein